MDTCGNCGRLIADTEQRFFDNNRIVCGQCIAMLRQPQHLGYAQPHEGSKTASGLGIAALVLGIVAMLVAWMPFCGIIVLPVAIVGLILGIFAIVTARGGRAGMGMPIAGTTLSGVAMLLQVGMWVYFAMMVQQNMKNLPAVIAASSTPIPTTRPAAPLAAARFDVNALELALDEFEIDNGRPPTSAEGLQALVTKPASLATWRGPYIKDLRTTDPWGNAYVYRHPGKLNRDGYDVYSFGPDGKEGGGDDVTNSDDE